MPPPLAPMDIRLVLFDVGGVLVELSGIEIMLGWLGNTVTADELWRRWLHSESVRRFETGRIDADEFARDVIREFGLRLERGAFLESFARWPLDLYPGVKQMLARIPRHYRRAVLSNSNALHWPRILDDMGVGDLFEHRFVSHLTGRIKPDTAAFEEVTRSIGCEPAEVLFLDDNLINVEAAAAFGMQVLHVRGCDEAQRGLEKLGIIAGARSAQDRAALAS